MTSSNNVLRHKSSATSNRSLASFVWLSDKAESGDRPTAVSPVEALSPTKSVWGMSISSEIPP